MKSIKIAGLCLVAVFAFSAVAVASASAAQPEFLHCYKVAKTPDHYEKVKAATAHAAEVRTPEVKEIYEGKYTGKLCGTSEEAASPGTWDGTETATTQNIEYKGPEGKYELEVVAPGGVPFTGKSKETAITFEGKTVTCKKSTGEGAIRPNGDGEETVTFGGCELPAETVKDISKPTVEKSVKVRCTTPGESVAGTIKTDKLGVLLRDANSGEKELDVAFYGLEGVFAEFTCEGASPAGYEPTAKEKMTAYGVLIGTVANTTKGQTVTFGVGGGGEQQPRTFWSEGEEVGPLTLEAVNDESEAESEMTVTTAEEQGPKEYGTFPFEL